MQIISELQYDRLRLKAKDMTRRIAQLSTEGSAFSTLLKQFGRAEVRLNQDETSVVQGAISEVGKLRHSMKQQMAKARVIDLTKTEKAAAQAPSDFSREQLNSKIVKAKDAIDETLDLLFNKDTKFKPIEPTPAVKVEEKVVGDSKLSEIKVGEIKLRGKVQLPARKVILDERQVSDMRKNLALFSS